MQFVPLDSFCMLQFPATTLAPPTSPRTPGTPDRVAPADEIQRPAAQGEYLPANSRASSSQSRLNIPAIRGRLQTGVNLYQQIYRDTSGANTAQLSAHLDLSV